MDIHHVTFLLLSLLGMFEFTFSNELLLMSCRERILESRKKILIAESLSRETNFIYEIVGLDTDNLPTLYMALICLASTVQFILFAL